MAFADFQSETSSENVDNFSLQAMSIDGCVDTTLLPYPCSHFYFDINFSNRLHTFKREEESLASFEYNLLANLISK